MNSQRHDHPAYLLAQQGQSQLLDRFERLQQRFQAVGRGGDLEHFVRIVGNGCAAVNMSLGRCYNFLETGKLLNVYDYAQQVSHEVQRPYAEVLRDELGKRFRPRTTIDQLLQLEGAYYAALNLEGPGPCEMYGECCVLLEANGRYAPATCYAGDSLHSNYLGQQPQRTEDEILSRYAVRDSLQALAAVEGKYFLPDLSDAVTPDDVRRHFDRPDTLMEIHLLGPITRDQVQAVVMRESDYDHLWKVARQVEHEPTTDHNKGAKLLPALLQVMVRHDLWLLLARP